MKNLYQLKLILIYGDNDDDGGDRDDDDHDVEYDDDDDSDDDDAYHTHLYYIQFYYGEKAPLTRKAFENLLKEIYPDIGEGFIVISPYIDWSLV